MLYSGYHYSIPAAAAAAAAATSFGSCAVPCGGIFCIFGVKNDYLWQIFLMKEFSKNLHYFKFY